MGFAWERWKRWRPASYVAIAGPTACFTDLGEQGPSEITRLWGEDAHPAGSPPNEDCLARVVPLNARRKQAKEIVLAAMILLLPKHDAIAFDSPIRWCCFHSVDRHANVAKIDILNVA